MTTWHEFPYFAWTAFALWMVGTVVALTPSRLNKLKNWDWAFFLAGALVFTAFVVLFWSSLGRPPMRTLGETRLWYALVLPFLGLLVRMRWGFRWLNVYCALMAAVFLLINIFKPEAHDKTLMPALQSPWFIPHVIVYIVGYALLGATTLVAAHGLFLNSKNAPEIEQGKVFRLAHQFAILGFVFVSAGLLFGGLWAKEAWGHYWTWDPKETWAFITWSTYLTYLHLHHSQKRSLRFSFTYLALAFVVLLVCWFGVNYLPSAETSVHTYTN